MSQARELCDQQQSVSLVAGDDQVSLRHHLNSLQSFVLEISTTLSWTKPLLLYEMHIGEKNLSRIDNKRNMQKSKITIINISNLGTRRSKDTVEHFLARRYVYTNSSIFFFFWFHDGGRYIRLTGRNGDSAGPNLPFSHISKYRPK